MSDNKDSMFVKTPESILKKRVVLNPLTHDKKSFMNSVIFALHSKAIGKDNTRPSNIRKYSDTINWDDTSFPPTSQDYIMLEKIMLILV